jgi:excisionase family DNA binding protein
VKDDAGGIIARTSAVLADLVNGRSHDRHSLADRFEITVASADRYIRHLQVVPGVVPIREGRKLAITFDFRKAVPWHQRRQELAARLDSIGSGAYLSPQQAAELLQVSVKTIRRRISSREWPHMRVGRQIRLNADVILGRSKKKAPR